MTDPMATGAWVRIPKGLARNWWPGGAAVGAEDDIHLFGGDRVAILGPSGSGKTTLLRILGLMDRPTLGTIDYRLPDCAPVSWNRDTSNRRAEPLRRTFGFVFQDARLLHYLSVLDNILVLPRLRGVTRPELTGYRDKALESMAMLRLGAPNPDHAGAHTHDLPLADSFPTRLSGGELRRVALLRALLADPRVLFADEPTSDVDRETSELVMREITRWADQHGQERILLFVTHSPSEALSYADRWLVLSPVAGESSRYRLQEEMRGFVQGLAKRDMERIASALQSAPSCGSPS